MALSMLPTMASEDRGLHSLWYTSLVNRPDPSELVAYHVQVRGDSAFQANARLAQSRWREWHGYPIGIHEGRPLGSRLELPWAQETLAGFLTPAIRDVVRREVSHAQRDRAKLYGRPR